MAPFPLTEFLCPLRRHRPLGAAPFHHFVVPLPPRAGGGKGLGTWSPSPCKRGEARFEVETRSPSPCKQGEARVWVNRPSPPCFSCPPPLGVGGERSETEGGIHVFLAHPHSGGGWRAERDGRGHQCNGAPFYSVRTFFTRC